MDIEYRIADTKYTDEIIAFLHEYFFKDAPICSCLQFDGKDDVTTAKLRPLIAAGTSYVAIARTPDHPSRGELVGVRIGGPHVEDDSNGSTHPPNEKWTILIKFMTELERQTQFGQRYNIPAEKIFYGLMLGVHRKFRGHSIGIELYRKSMDLAENLGYKLYCCDCTSFYAAQLCDKLDMDLVNVLPFNEYCDEDGRQVFVTELPHTATRSYAKLL